MQGPDISFPPSENLPVSRLYYVVRAVLVPLDWDLN